MNLLVDLKDAYEKIGINVEGASITNDDISLTLTAEVHVASSEESVLVRKNSLKVYLRGTDESIEANQGLKKVLASALGLSEHAVLIDNGQRTKLKKIVLNYQVTPEKTAVYFKSKIESLC